MTQINRDKTGVHRTSYYLYTPAAGAISNCYALPAPQATAEIQSQTRGVTG
ncbi:hypothetical protein [Methanocella arvoryzae]|uniref:hypothetical protein n=1 Tax=Methanocella arvoryzae TaxID=1175445 RepID=UPI0013053B1A|nr:hypothetical protein [Methanocella arvoryzae]